MFNNKPKNIDFIILGIFTILITWQPYYLHGKLNVFELGIYLPGINALLDGQVPYRDFFHLRGPFELYIPALFMRVFGENISVLMACFYIGTVATLLLYVMLARNLLRTRLILYLFVPLLIARTFPRVVFTYWGGVRYTLGTLAVLLSFQYFRTKKISWLYASGIIAGISFFTSIDVGTSALAGIFFALVLAGVMDKEYKGSVLAFAVAGASVFIFYGAYLFINGALGAYIDSVMNVVLHMQGVFNVYAQHNVPQNALEFVGGLINPASRFFRYLTPVYCYLFLAAFFVYLRKNNKLTFKHFGVLSVGLYGLLMYILAFRNIESQAFEMALQPQKLILFYLLEEAYLFLKEKKAQLKPAWNQWKVHGINLLIVVLIGSSLGYAVTRYHHRFFAAKYLMFKLTGQATESLKPLAGQETTRLDLKRAQGLVLPSDQAKDLIEISSFIKNNTERDEAVFMYPEMGLFSFLVDRPFTGRFPMATFSWLSPEWHQELMADFNESRPAYVIMDKQLGHWFEEIYFKVPINRTNFMEFKIMIDNDYDILFKTPSYNVYKNLAL